MYILKSVLFLVAFIGFLFLIIGWTLSEMTNAIGLWSRHTDPEGPEEAVELSFDIFLGKRFWRWLRMRVYVD
jgi:hypothetical protein